MSVDGASPGAPDALARPVGFLSAFFFNISSIVRTTLSRL